MGTAVTWYGSTILESASTRLAAYHQLPPIVQGGVIAAVGSSFPELSSVVLATLLHGSFDLGVSAIAGSAIFNITVIPALAAFAAKGILETSRDLVYKEAQFYILSVAVLLLVFSLAVVYYPVDAGVAATGGAGGGTAGGLGAADGLGAAGGLGGAGGAGDGSGVQRAVAGDLVGNVTRGLALIPLGAYGVYLFTQWQDTMDYEPELEAEEVSPLREWARLAASLVVVLVGVEALVRSAIRLGDLLNVPSTFWGVTVIAVGTSLPDTFYSVQASRNAQAESSLANVLGSNVFDLLVAVPAGVLLAGTVPVNFSRAVPMLGTLTVMTLVLFAFMRTELRIGDREAWMLLGLYAGFIVWMALETIGVVPVPPWGG